MKLLFACHKHPYYSFGGKPRGGEKSVRIIMQYLRREGFEVTAWARGCLTETIEDVWFHPHLEKMVKDADFVLTWGNAAPEAARLCITYNKPYILMIRWWRLIQPLPPGDLMNRNIDRAFVAQRQYIFDNAKAVISNNEYAAKVIHRMYGVHALVSYVPVEGKANNVANPKGALTIVTPDKGLGEWRFINNLLEAMPDERIMVVNPEQNINLRDTKRKFGERLIVQSYTPDMTEVWGKTKILLLPVFDNDICGTTRVAIEAQQHGVPVIATNRCGINEKVDNLVASENKLEDWVYMVEYVSDYHKAWSKGCINNFNEYNTPAQLQIFKNEILR